ncbi:hypothetical protein ABB37_10066 [Leptomonas pyrrhocoris]|uniref:C3H1-type domain-containing protein n=1 Tax=Leptomonas pyrrhocoris TaxID=157538 RepID=A0A0N0DQL9_LEPPY|nr:hypothetical protein ABB37_10066 [Leptomonas pyrrhocoris]KPA73164.1 hypothetical protein ABB37_10066 [Leptomonas pyrrhocoris]|eukprot:XP_015651603.1 hypothetical protein ABB37_10066 [Leptomonas pyrrhocoris]
MFTPYPIQQRSANGMPATLVYPQTYYTNASLPYPVQGYGGVFGTYGNAPVMVAGTGKTTQPVSMYAGHSVTPMYFVMEPNASASVPATLPTHAVSAAATPAKTVCCAALDASSTSSDMKLSHSGSWNSLSTQSCSWGGESASQLSSGLSASSVRTRPQHDVGIWGFALVDQLHPSLQRIPVPPSCVCEPTVGISLYDNDVVASSTRRCKSSVCLLHAQGLGCAEGARCRCFHVSPQYLQQCRDTTESLCCSLHNCYYSQEMLGSNCAPHLVGRRFVLSLDDPSRFPQDGGKPHRIDLSLLNFSLTVGLETLPYVDGAYVISWKKRVCHLNIDGKCKWTKDCGHIHMCRQLTKVLQDAESLTVIKALQAKNTPKNAADLYRDIILSETTLRYVRSSSVYPLVASLIAAGDVDSLKALAKAQCALLPSQYAAVRQLGVETNSGDAVSRAAPISPKLVGLLMPKLY